MAKSWKSTYKSGYLRAADLPPQGRRVKIVAIAEQQLDPSEPPKLICDLHDQSRWVLNKTCCELLEAILGTDDPDMWVGRVVELYRDATVRDPSGKLVGGVRCRAPSTRPAPAPPPPDVDDLTDDDLANGGVDADGTPF